MKRPISHLTDPDMQNVPKALIRAAERARRLAQETGTEFVVVRNGELVREIPKPPAEGQPQEKRKPRMSGNQNS